MFKFASESQELARLHDSFDQQVKGHTYTAALWSPTVIKDDSNVHKYVKSYNVVVHSARVSQPIRVKASDKVCNFQVYGSSRDCIVTIETSTVTAAGTTEPFEFSSLCVSNSPGHISTLSTTDRLRPDQDVIYRYAVWIPEDNLRVNPSGIKVGIYVINE